jgi:hypothetical protein
MSLLGQPSSPGTGVAAYVVRLDRSHYYSLDFKITQTFGPIKIAGVPGASLPRGFQASPAEMPTTEGYNFIVAMQYEINTDTHDMEFVPQNYAKWADDLFSGLKEKMSFGSRSN